MRKIGIGAKKEETADKALIKNIEKLTKENEELKVKIAQLTKDNEELKPKK